MLSSQQHDDEITILDKQQVLMDMERLKLQGVKLTKEWNLNDRLDDMQFEVRRHMLHIDEMNNINMMRDGMRLLCSGFEMVNTKMGILELDGWAAEVCSDIDKYDNALGRIYRKYWRKNGMSSPEVEIAFGLIGSIGLFHFKQKMQRNVFQNRTSTTQNARPAPMREQREQSTVEKFSDSEYDSDESAPPQ
jgi:hypothetical protein